MIKNPLNINLDIFLESNDGKNLNTNINIRIKKDIQIYAVCWIPNPIIYKNDNDNI